MSAVTKLKPNPLKLLQKEFSLLDLGGKFGVFRPDSLIWVSGMPTAPALYVYQVKDAAIAMKRFIETMPVSTKPTELINQFYSDPLTTVYQNIAFTPEAVSSTTLNLWLGHTITPKAGPWQALKQYLLYVICDGDEIAFDYLIRFIAHALQKPEEKPGVMIVLLSGQGTGKGTLEIILRKIWAATILMVNDVESVVGRFNARLERSFIVFMDEALFRGDGKSSDRLKSLVTAKHIQIEEKYQPERTIESHHRFIAASNQEHFNRTEYDDRRMYYLRVSERFKDNPEYWSHVHTAIKSGEVGAMADDLLTMDISDFNVRQRPASNELLNQKLKSLTGLERFWFDALWNGLIYGCGQYIGNFDSDWIAGKFWQTDSILRAYKNKYPSEQRYNPADGRELSEVLKRICPSAVNVRRQVGGDRRWGYDLPELSIARGEMGVYLGGKPNWPPA